MEDKNEYWLAIDIVDNDFCHTGEETLRNIGVSYQDKLNAGEFDINRSTLFFDKKKLGSVLKHLFKIMYYTHQNPFAYEENFRNQLELEQKDLDFIDWEFDEDHIALGFDEIEALQKELMYGPENFHKTTIYNRACDSSLCILHVTKNNIQIFTV